MEVLSLLFLLPVLIGFGMPFYYITWEQKHH
jgi:hypothetical protein